MSLTRPCRKAKGFMIKQCKSCNAKKDISEFYIKLDRKQKGYSGSDECFYSSRCKDCDREKQRLYRKANPEKAKDIDLFQSFGIRYEQYNKMYNDQKGCCAICLKHSSEFKRALAVDHCHATGKIRGLLCYLCNTSLGKIKDDISILERMIKYLKTNSDLADSRLAFEKSKSEKKEGYLYS